jgi:hypothetical protein
MIWEYAFLPATCGPRFAPWRRLTPAMVAQDQIFSAAVIRLLSELIAGLERLRCGFIKSGGLHRF